MTKFASEEAVEGIGRGGDDEDADGGPSESLVGGICSDTQAVVDCDRDEDGNQQKPKDGDVGGNRHVR